MNDDFDTDFSRDRRGFGRGPRGFWGGPRGFGHGGHNGFGPGGGFSPEGLWESFDQLRASFDRRVGPRMGRGDVRSAVLLLLLEQPMHGYQIIQEIGERSGGAWKPSAGSVYPTLQLLADEGLLRASEEGGRKSYHLTEAGTVAAEELAEKPAPWEIPGVRGSGRLTELPKAGMELAQVVALVARSGSPEQIAAATELLTETRKRLYALLAES